VIDGNEKLVGLVIQYDGNDMLFHNSMVTIAVPCCCPVPYTSVSKTDKPARVISVIPSILGSGILFRYP
jgi:hypothetical protein